MPDLFLNQNGDAASGLNGSANYGSVISDETNNTSDNTSSQDNYHEKENCCDGEGDGGGRDDDHHATYYNLLKENRCFRLYMLSYVITHMGEWLTYIASIALAEELLQQQGIESRTTISILVVVRLLPNVLLSPFGGILADGRDRRQSMIWLDALGAISPLLFLLAMKFQSIPVIYVVTFLQQCISGLYEPCRSSIIPQMVPDEDYLKKATTLAGLAWSIFAAVGSSLGGMVLTWFGFKACFFVDSATYLTSAYLMWLVGGTWNVATTSDDQQTMNGDKNDNKVSVWGKVQSMAMDGFYYLKGSFWGPLVLLKASGGIVYGASDVLNVSFSEPNGIGDSQSPARLGMLFACAGVGCTLGPLLADRYTDMRKPTSLQKVCICAIFFAAFGFFIISILDPFWTTCVFTLVRSGGASVNWIDSSILLQKFSTDEMMGRVLAVDFGLALFTEASSAYIAGYLQDQWHLGAHQVAFVMSCIGFVLAGAWLTYHLAGLGAAAAPPEEEEEEDKKLDKTNDEKTPLV